MLDVLNLAYLIALFFIPIIGYILFFKDKTSGRYSAPAWYSFIKRLLAKNVIDGFLRNSRVARLGDDEIEGPIDILEEEEEDLHEIVGCDQKGNSVYIKFITKKDHAAEVIVQIRLKNGQLFEVPNEHRILVCTTKKGEWRSEKLQIVCVEAYKVYKVSYDGKMRCGDCTEQLKFDLMWCAGSSPLFYPSECAPALFSDAISREPWRDGDWLRILGDRTGYEQYGLLHGDIKSPLLPPEGLNLQLPSCRTRCWGTSERYGCYRDAAIFIATDDGTLARVGARSIRHGCTQLRYGSILYPDGVIRCITSSDISLQHLGESKNFPKAFTVHLKTKKSSVKCVLHTHPYHQTTSLNTSARGWELRVSSAETCLDVQRGRALLLFGYHIKGAQPITR